MDLNRSESRLRIATDMYDLLKTTLFQDNATAGEAAGYALGLLNLGFGSKKANTEMTAYARETQHEKIIRSLAVGRAFIYYDRQETAAPIIDSLVEEKVSVGVYSWASV